MPTREHRSRDSQAFLWETLAQPQSHQIWGQFHNSDQEPEPAECRCGIWICILMWNPFLLTTGPPSTLRALGLCSGYILVTIRDGLVARSRWGLPHRRLWRSWEHMTRHKNAGIWGTHQAFHLLNENRRSQTERIPKWWWVPREY